ncbi:MAG: MarR family transcriptional regulator [Bacilli bacterium]|nr:MarR family transcriptional regulator [Bacilli bacterium]
MAEIEKSSLKLEHQLCFPLYAAAREVVNLYTPFFQPLGITYTQYIVFLLLWEKDGVPVKELTQRLYLDTGTLTPLLKKMEKSGYIRKERDKKDERVVKVFLTKKGLSLKEKAAEIPQSVGSCIPLEGKEAEVLYHLLYKVLGVSK